MSVMLGRLRQARLYYERARAVAADQSGHLLPTAGLALIDMGDLLREWNDPAAEELVRQGIALTREWLGVGTFEGYLALARIRLAQKDMDGAQREIAHAADLARRYDVSDLDDVMVEAYQAYLWIVRGDLEAAARWCTERGLAAPMTLDTLMEQARRAYPFYHTRELEYTMHARLLLAQDKPREALQLLRLLQAVAETMAREGSVIQILVLQALALQAQGDMAQALVTLGQALAKAGPEGYVRVFVDNGAPMAHLLRLAASRGLEPEYAATLLAAFTAPEQATQPQPLAEPLTSRELDILRFLAADLTSTEIANQLIIAPSTVRSHIKSIYGKLSVHERRQAIQRAKELRLL
jgi:LuxR family maltose regulon positive regulatory protein